jgi:hypothetical protein
MCIFNYKWITKSHLKKKKFNNLKERDAEPNEVSVLITRIHEIRRLEEHAKQPDKITRQRQM